MFLGKSKNGTASAVFFSWRKKFGMCLDARREAPCFMGMNSRGLLSRGKEKLAVNLFHAFAQIQNNYDELQTNMQYIAQKRRYNEYRESGHEKKSCHAFVRNSVACCRITSAEKYSADEKIGRKR